MNKILILLLIISSFKPWDFLKNINLGDFRNNDVLKFSENLDNKIILTKDEIKKYNALIKTKTDALYDLNFATISMPKLKALITSYQMPSLPKYDGTKEITTSEITNILANRNLEKIPVIKNVEKGLIVKRTNLRSFPSAKPFYDDLISPFDRLQETALTPATPVLILHESKDQKYYFLMSNDYYGWVKKEDVMLVNNTDFETFLNPSQFIVITSSMVKVDDIYLDMGVKLPLVDIDEESYRVFIFKTNGKQIINIKKEDANIGYLDYTYLSLINQAFKYEGVSYSWGGKDMGVDCSSFIQNIYHTFGFIFPRNTSSQNNSVGDFINLANMNNAQKLEAIKDKNPALLYQKGHVMLYLGEKENAHYIIHASGNKKNLKVVVEKLNTTYLQNIEKIVFIN